VRLENKNISFCFEKRSSLLCTHNAGDVVVNSVVNPVINSVVNSVVNSVENSVLNPGRETAFSPVNNVLNEKGTEFFFNHCININDH
jgi:hypothetical protein